MAGGIPVSSSCDKSCSASGTPYARLPGRGIRLARDACSKRLHSPVSMSNIVSTISRSRAQSQRTPGGRGAALLAALVVLLLLVLVDLVARAGGRHRADARQDLVALREVLCAASAKRQRRTETRCVLCPVRPEIQQMGRHLTRKSRQLIRALVVRLHGTEQYVEHSGARDYT